MSDLGPITMEAFVVKVTPINNLELVIERKPFTFTWNPGAGAYDVGGGEVSSEVVEVGTVEKATQPPERKVVGVDTGQPFTLDGYIMQNWQYEMDDGTRYNETMRIGPSGELYSILPGGGIRVSTDKSGTWGSHSGPIPRAFNQPALSGGDEDIH